MTTVPDVARAGSKDQPRAASHVQSIERAAALLRALAVASGPDATASALAERVGLNRTTTWRILAALERERMVHHDRGTGSYSLGLGLVDLAADAGAALARASRAVLREVTERTGEATALAQLWEESLLYVAEEVPADAVSTGWVGREAVVHATSTGKALLAFVAPRQARTLLGRSPGDRLPRYTPTTLTSLARLQDELDEVRVRGFAVGRGELDAAVWGVSAPVLDRSGRPRAVLTVWGSPDRLGEERLPVLAEVVREGAAAIAALGAPG